MVRKYENGMVVFQTRICCTGAFRLITRVFQCPLDLFPKKAHVAGDAWGDLAENRALILARAALFFGCVPGWLEYQLDPLD